MAAPAARKAQFEITSEWVAALYGAAIAALWLLTALVETPVSDVLGQRGGTTLVIYGIVQLGLMYGLIRRNRVAWVFAVAISGSLLVSAAVVFGIAVMGGDLLQGLYVLLPYLLLFSSQLVCAPRMAFGGDPRLMAGGAGLATAVLWMVAGLTDGRWTAASLAGFGGGGMPLTAIVILALLEAGLSIGILMRSRAAWAFALSLAATLALPLIIAVTRMHWQGDFVNATTALFLHVTLLPVQAMAFDSVGPASQPISES